MAPPPSIRFDFAALHEALDRQRRERGLSWAAVAREIRVSTSTLAAVKKAQVLEGDGLLGMVRWLGCAPERFTTGAAEIPAGPMTKAGEVGPGQYLRFETRAIYTALDAQRRAREITWQEAAGEIGLGVSSLTHLAKGGRTAVPGVMRIAAWLGASAESLTHVTDW